MVAPPALSTASRVGSTVDDAPTDSLPDMVTRDKNLPQLDAIGAMLCANTYIILSMCMYFTHLHATQGCTAMRVHAASVIAAAVIAIASAALGAARMASDAARQRAAAAEETEEHAARVRLHEYELARKDADHSLERATLREALTSAGHEKVELLNTCIDALARVHYAATHENAKESKTATPERAAQQHDAQPLATHQLAAQTLDAEQLDAKQLDAQSLATHQLAAQTLDTHGHGAQPLETHTLTAQTPDLHAFDPSTHGDVSEPPMRAPMTGTYLPPGVLFESEPEPAPALLRIAPPTFVNPDDAARIFDERMAEHFAHVNGARPTELQTGVAAVLAAAPAAPTRERRSWGRTHGQ